MKAMVSIMSMYHYFYLVNKVQTSTGDVVYTKWSDNPMAKSDYDDKMYMKELFYRCRHNDVGDKVESWFDWIKSEQLGKDLRRDLGFESESDLKWTQFSVLELDKVTKKQMEYVKSGYFLSEDVQRYTSDDDCWLDDVFYDKLTPEVYAAKVGAEAKMSKEALEVARENGDRLASDYMWYMYEDYASLEYGIAFAKEVAELFEVKDAALLHYMA